MARINVTVCDDLAARIDEQRAEMMQDSDPGTIPSRSEIGRRALRLWLELENPNEMIKA